MQKKICYAHRDEIYNLLFSSKNIHEMYIFFYKAFCQSYLIHASSVNVFSELSFCPVWSPISLRLRVLQKGSSERREKRRLSVIVHSKENLFKRRDLTRSILRSILSSRVLSRDAWRQHHRSCPGRRFGCPAPSMGMRTHQWLTVCPIVSTYRYTHGNLSQELVAIVIN